MCGAKNNEKQRGLLHTVNGIKDKVEDILKPYDDNTTEEEIDKNLAKESPPKDGNLPSDTSEIESDEMPPEPENIKLKFVLYAVNSKETLYHCTFVSHEKSLYQKKKKLFIYIKGIKETSGKKLSWNKVAKLNPDERNFINLVYIKGESERVPVKDTAIILMHFLKCIKREKANVHDIKIEGGKVAKKIFKFYKKHKPWLKK